MAEYVEVNESPLVQRPAERVPYTLDTTPWGGTPTNVAITLRDLVSNTDVSAAQLSGATPAPSGNVITTPAVIGVVAGRRYRLEMAFDAPGGARFVPYLVIIGVA